MAEPPSGADDSDSFANLLEYILGLDPTRQDGASAHPVVVRNKEEGSVSFSFSMASAIGGDVEVWIESSSTLMDWTVLTRRESDGTWEGQLPVTISSAESGRRRVTLVQPGATEERVFYRLAVGMAE